MKEKKPIVSSLYEGQNTDVHNNLVETLVKAWETLDASLIEPLLHDELHYYSWWVMSEMHSKGEYMEYIKAKYKTIREAGTCPLVKLAISNGNGEFAVALQQGDNPPALIRIEEMDGKIKEMWMQPV